MAGVIVPSSSGALQLGRPRTDVVTTFVLALAVGFYFGYKAKEWRIRWTKFRRDRLAQKLAETQKTLDSL